MMREAIRRIRELFELLYGLEALETEVHVHLENDILFPRALARVGATASRSPAGDGNRIPIRRANPERICWGCDKYCPADPAFHLERGVHENPGSVRRQVWGRPPPEPGRRSC